MIRHFIASDMDVVLDIWLKASIDAHHFIDEGFWVSKVNEMRDIYIPMSETYVYELENRIIGFISLYQDVLAAVFVYPEEQGKGVGKCLLNKAISVRESLNLSVYCENKPSIAFYKQCGVSVVRTQRDEHTGHEEFLMAFCKK